MTNPESAPLPEVRRSEKLRDMIVDYLPAKATTVRHRSEAHYFYVSGQARNYVSFSYDSDEDDVVGVQVVEEYRTFAMTDEALGVRKWCELDMESGNVLFYRVEHGQVVNGRFELLDKSDDPQSSLTSHILELVDGVEPELLEERKLERRLMSFTQIELDYFLGIPDKL